MARHSLLLLSAASLASASLRAFTVTDDVFTFPQYEVAFSTNHILVSEVEALLAEEKLNGRRKGTEQSDDVVQFPPNSVLAQSHPRFEGKEDSQSSSEETRMSYERMILHSEPYLCAIPEATIPTPEDEKKTTPSEEEEEAQRATEKGLELLTPLAGSCLYFMSGWWSYSFCYNSDIRQFHPLPPGKNGVPLWPPAEDQDYPGFTLGTFDQPLKPRKQLDALSQSKVTKERMPSDTSLATVEKKGDTQYLVQRFGGGTTCDLTGKPRTVEIQFHCHQGQQDRIGWIKEVRTCHYTMVVYTSKLCDDLAFLPPKGSEALQIECRQIVADSDEKTFVAKKLEEAEEALLEAVTADTKQRPVLGGIEIGGFKISGQGSRPIEAPNVGAPRQAKSKVLASWDPKLNNGNVKTLSKAELRELEVSWKNVEQMKAEVQKMAKERPWEIQLVDDDIGKELRAIIHTDGDDEEDEKQHEEKNNNDESTHPETEKGGNDLKDEL